MAKYRKKPVEIEAITFDELVEYGKANGANIVDGMPWSFKYKGQPITHENNNCYLINTEQGETLEFRSSDVLAVIDGYVAIYDKCIFELHHERIAELTFQERVIAEKSELDEKITKLGMFLTSDAVNTLKRHAKSLLVQQHCAMLAYSYILRDRIELFKEN